MIDPLSQIDSVVLIHADVDRRATALHVLHAARLQCRRGCSSCCVDDLTVFDAEADIIRLNHGALLASGAPGPEGSCAFLDDDGACRIYADRPYVCRTQGLPLRWTEDDVEDARDATGATDAGDAGDATEYRDICPLNEAGEPLELLEAEDCWTLGPIEERLGRLQVASGAGARRTRLRDLFASASRGHVADGSPSSVHLEPKR